ncbi:hypothetical protein I6F66_17505 [Pseudoalteromonas sp. NZS100_1]|uniref:hypothetical protein n=1 Tax=Pseudoalteromonas sp. NZS100_1 TaxID=2792073 RepID=UPI0018CDB72B|nr:hypothetical protein [Pseudoalteromonas sp. NZS100_1]MBH0013879.1 hypothetical protein [Pseudoalteromonas sp. NZS100_1]
MDLRELGHFLEFTLKLQPLLFLIISIVAVYLSFKMLSNAKASRAHEERMKLAEVKMNIRSLFAKSIDNLTEIYHQHNIAFMKLQTYFPNYSSVNLNKQKEMLDVSKAQLEEFEETYKNYIENIESSIALEDSIKFLLKMQGSCFVSPRNSISTEKIFDDILQRAEDLEKQLSNIKNNRIRDKSDFHN